MTGDLLIAFYGDDFSGSTDVMEALALAGVPTVLFLDPPTSEQIARFSHARAVGVAGVTRSLATEPLATTLQSTFGSLAALQPQLVHYKICSTFDSSPTVGSIGRAIECGIDVLQPGFVPLVVGAPILQRFVAFGNLFARSGLDSPVYRLDRHPTMSRHPITPMDESDLRILLSRQTALTIGLVDSVQLDKDAASVRRAVQWLVDQGDRIILFDTMRTDQLAKIGEAIWQHTPFVVGSSGVEYALAAHWHSTGDLGAPRRYEVGQVDQVVVVSGSCSPVTQRQILAARDAGFVDIAVDPVRLLTPSSEPAERQRLREQAGAALRDGHSVILHTSRGPDDARLTAARRWSAASDTAGSVGPRLATALGRSLQDVLDGRSLRRIVVAGGDTSGYVARQLGIEALELAAPVAPGSPLCRIHTAQRHHPLSGAEIVFKGGQVGRPDFFERVRCGTAAAESDYEPSRVGPSS